MHDDGLNGDARAGDHIFTLQTTIFQPNPGSLSLRVSAGFQGSLSRTFSPIMTITVTGTGTAIAIASPAVSAYLNTSPTLVNGSVADPSAHVTVNGIAAQVTGGAFSASVPLQEGTNTLTAVAQNSNGTSSTDSRVVTLDTTPPHVSIDAPANNAVTTDSSVTVTGLVNDIVVGTVNSQQATVTVNGVPATVVNRTYTASNIPLSLGSNTIQATGRDRAGNGATVSVTVTRQPLTQPYLRIVSGNNLSGPIRTLLAAPLVVQLVSASGQAIPNTPVVFRVTSSDGTVTAGGPPGMPSMAVNTNAQGQAQVNFILGSHAGAGNNMVTVSSAGVATTPVFTESGNPTAASMIVVDSGNDQSGVIGQALPLPFIAIVTDAGHNRIGNVPVTFTVTQGSGTISGQPSSTTTSDSDGRVQTVLTLGPQDGINNNQVTATFAGNPGLPVTFSATGRVPGPTQNTKISGVVLNNSNVPISNVTMRLFQTQQGNNNNVPQQIGTPVPTNAQGYFQIQPAPVGVFKLMADGTTGGNYPTLEYDIVTVSGQNNTVGLPIYLPLLNPGSQLCVSPTTGGTLTIPQAPGFALTVAAGSATFPGGSRSGCVSVTPVNMDKIPMVPGFGQQPRFIVTIQPVGTTFNPPAAITIPNVDGLAPRAVTEMYSYDHDLASFVAIGTGTVSSDGSVIASDPGVGVLKAGWHCGGDPNTSGSAGSLGVTLAAASSTATAGTTVTMTANGTPPLDGTYINWEVIDDPADPNDDPTVAVFVSQPGCPDQPTCAAQLRGVKIGIASVRVTFKCLTTGATVTSAIVKVTFNIGLQPKEVSFFDNLSINKDQVSPTGITPINNPVWLSTNAPADNNPVGYVQGKTMRVTVKFAINPVPASPVSNVTIKGNIPGLGNFVKTGVTIPAAAEVVVADILADTPLPASRTTFYNPMTINWSHMADGKSCPNCTADGSTANKVYVTLAAPTDTVYLTSLHLAVSSDGATNNTQAINKSWAFFGNGTAPTNVKGWDNRPFIYYPAGTPFSGCATSIVALLTTPTGGARCGAFAQFFQNVLAMNGIASVITVVDPAEDSGMLVKNWTYKATPSFPASPQYKWSFVTVGFNEMVPAPAAGGVYGDMTSGSGVPGENSPTPSEKAHINHAIVKAPDTGVYYDPSYGLTYSGAADFETKALDGYILHVPGDPNTQYRVRKSTGLNKATFTP
jgi:hypothetical protein